MNSIYNQIGTNCPKSKHQFANDVAKAITQALEHYRNGKMIIRGYTPPYENSDFPEGYLELSFTQTGQDEMSVGIEFGNISESNIPLRCEFDRTSWEDHAHDPLCSGIVAINFDEAWRISCLVIQQLCIENVIPAYGY